MNLINYCLGKPEGNAALAKVAETLRVREMFDDLFFIRREPLISRHGEEEPLLLKFIFDRLCEAAKKAKDMEYKDVKKMCNYRGQGVLVIPGIKLRLTEEKLNDVLVDSVDKREFDESLLLWHIATDLCQGKGPESLPVNEMKTIGKTLSEYMLYLLIKQPEMLSVAAGIGEQRYRDTCAEARRFFGSAAAWDPDHDDARRMLLSVNTSKKPLEVKGDRSKLVLFDAVILAKALRELDDELMWEVVAGVWWEMLMYAAANCQKSTHVRQLSRGGELLTMVWFLMVHMGISDMYQIQEGDVKAKLIVHDK